MAAKRPKTVPQRVPTIEEIKEINRRRNTPGYEPQPTPSTPAGGSSKPVTIKIDSPPVGVIPVDQTPTQTLAKVEGKSLCVSEILAQHDINPVEELLAMYNERVEDPESPDYGKFVMSRSERVSLMKEIMKYQHPTLKAVEHKGNADDRRITVVLMMPDGTSHHKDVEQRGKVIDA
jgi:hypothetical protein